MKRTILISLTVALLALSACRDKTEASPAPDAQAGSMKLISSSFQPGGEIPKQFTCDGENVSPALAWSGAPAKTQSFALVMHDPDAPFGDYTHWVLFNILPDITQLAQADQTGTAGQNGEGKNGYKGPCPPNGRHHYVFHLYALDGMFDLREGASRGQLEQAVKGHVLGETELTGTYSR